MNAQVTFNSLPQVKTVEQYISTTNEKVFQSEQPLYKVVRIPYHIIEDLHRYLDDRAENAEPREFDDDGYLESLTEEGEDSIESLLSHLFTVKADKNEYEVTITLRVEAFSEEEAEQEANNNIHDYEWDVSVKEI